MKRGLLAAGFVCLTPSMAAAHEVNFGSLETTRPNIVHVRAGAEYGFVSGVGYSRVFQIRGRPLVATGDLTLPIAHPGGGDYRVRASVQLPAIGRDQWWLVPRVSPVVRGLKTDFNRLTNVGFDVGLTGGYYAKRWFIAGELGVDTALSTHIRHSDSYRDTVYADAKDGWYAMTGANAYYGLLGGYSTPRVDIVGRVGQARNFVDGRTGLLPAYATINLNVRF